MIKTFLITFVERLEFDVPVGENGCEEIQPIKITARITGPDQRAS